MFHLASAGLECIYRYLRTISKHHLALSYLSRLGKF